MRILVISNREQFQTEMTELEKLADVDYEPGLSRETLLEKVADTDILIPGFAVPATKEIVDAGNRLKLIQVLSVGYENVDVDAATKRGVMVCNTGGVNAEAVAELTWGLILGLARQIPGGDRLMREGKWGRFLGGQHTTLWGKTLGIIGFGAIGQRVGLKGRLAFNMRILAYDPYIIREVVEAAGGEMVPLEKLLAESDIVSIHVPSMDSTRHLIAERELAMMKPTAYLINTARGALIDEKALVEALIGKKIAGAGLDVFEVEPLPEESPLRKLDNVVMLSHIGTDPETGKKMVSAAIENITRFVHGEKPMRIVNPSFIKYQ